MLPAVLALGSQEEIIVGAMGQTEEPSMKMRSVIVLVKKSVHAIKK